MKSVPFGNFNMCNKFDFKMFKNSVSIGIKTPFLKCKIAITSLIFKLKVDRAFL